MLCNFFFSSDFTIILISFICLLLETKVQRWIVLAAVRPFKLLRLVTGQHAGYFTSLPCMYTLLLSRIIHEFVINTSSISIEFPRVLRLKRRFRDIGSTTIVLLPRLANIVILLICIYYFFAIIGIELLNGTVYRGCWLANIQLYTN